MTLLFRRITTLSILLLLSTNGLAAVARVDDSGSAVNPLRLSYINGNVSFWRYGAEDWVEARINTPLAAGDALYTSNSAALELQPESRAFIRADEHTQITLVNQTPDFLQVKVTSGRVSLDLRTLPTSSYTIEIDTPNAAFTIDRTGYYRVDVDGDVHFITRRGGRATLISTDGEAMSILPSEEIVVQGGIAQAESYVAPEPDAWDRWNYDRTANQIDAVSERYLPSGIAGARDLDHYGNWRISDDYGPVWVPDTVPTGWAPYSAGQWLWDPIYQWSWVDDAPWGWAPFHYGRWVYLGGYWSWCPGPVAIRRPIYAPALVAFYGVRSHTSVNLSFGGPGVGWIALGWGEPLMPWWGRQGFIGRPWWGGWGGPRVVNNVIVRRESQINITNITYSNSHVKNALIVTPEEHFGRGHVHENSDHLEAQNHELEHIRGALPVKPNSGSLVADVPRGERPPQQVISRPVISTRRPQEAKLPWRIEATNPVNADQHYVPVTKPASTDLRRPEFGTQTGPERERPGLPPRYEEWKRQAEPATPSRGVADQRQTGKAGSKLPPIAPSEPSTSARTNSQPNEPSIVPARITPQEEPTSPASRIDSLPPSARVAPQQESSSRGERDFVTSTPTSPHTAPPNRQPQAPNIEIAPQPTRNAAPDAKTFPRSASDLARPVTPSGNATLPEHRQQMQHLETSHPSREYRTDLPGVPANRPYRGGDSKKQSP